jgi:hypothetical protein
MRRVAFLVAVGVIIPLAGCNTTKWNMFRGKESNPPPAVMGTPSAAALVKYLNDNADRVDSIRCASLELQCSQGFKSVTLSGKMACQKPRNFRMSATVFGKQEIDLGSNDKEFWYWIARGDPYQFYCSYQDLADGKVRRLPFPFQPDWILAALGMAKYGAGDRQVLVKKDTWELVEKTKSPQGKAVRKVIVFRSSPAPRGQPQVLAHTLVDDATGNVICSAQITKVQMDQQSGAVIPYKVVLSWPETKIKLSMTLDEVTFNPRLDSTDNLFARPTLTNIKSYDLAQLPAANPTGRIRQVEGRSQ